MAGARKIGPILDSCMNREVLESVYPLKNEVKEIFLSASEVRERHKTLRGELFEKVSLLAQKELGSNLNGEEIFEVLRRVDQFLIDRNYLIKP